MELKIEDEDQVFIDTRFGTICVTDTANHITISIIGQIARRGREEYGLVTSDDDNLVPTSILALRLERNDINLKLIRTRDFKTAQHDLFLTPHATRKKHNFAFARLE